MSNFFNSKLRIWGFTFSLISLCGIIGGSVMLALGNNMTVNTNNVSTANNTVQKDSNDVDLMADLENTTPYTWKENINFLQFDKLVEVNDGNGNWRYINASDNIAKLLLW